MESKDILLVILPIITAIISSSLTYFFTIRTRQQETITKFKEEKYSNLIVALQGFLGSTTSTDTKKIFYEEQYKSWLYSSDDVVRATNELTNLLISEKGRSPNPEVGRKVVGSIILEMRKDLLGRTNLTYKDFRYTDVID